VISVPAGVRVLVATKPVDFRRGADSLAALAKGELQRDPFSGTILVFRSKRADRLKILAWDGSGLYIRDIGLPSAFALRPPRSGPTLGPTLWPLRYTAARG